MHHMQEREKQGFIANLTRNHKTWSHYDSCYCPAIQIQSKL